jgi:hypothetical protein
MVFVSRCLVGSCVIALLASSTTVAGQTARSASIAGAILDESGGVLPGVAVTLTSPALQVRELNRVSDERGEYQFVDLPPGTYRLTYELEGFSTLAREDIRLTTGFAARVDVSLKVGALAQTLTVTGQSPLVDVTNTRGGTTVSKELLASTPNNQNYQDVLLLAGGTYIPGPPKTGETGSRNQGNSAKSYGQSGYATNEVEGIKMHPNEVPDFASVEEVDVKTFGNTAETDQPGAVIQLIVKSGGNQFHGRYKEMAQHMRFQSTNVDDALRAQGVSAGDAIRYYHDFSGDLGGRIVRDKLWFYGAFRDVRNDRTAPGYATGRGPDGRYGTLDDPIGTLPGKTQNTTIKLSQQLTNNHKLIGFFSRGPFDEGEYLGSRFLPYESTSRVIETPRQAKVEWQGLLSERLLANMMYADAGYVVQFWAQDQSLNVPNRLDNETGIQTGHALGTFKRAPWRKQWSGRVDYLPAGDVLGSHQLTAGYRIWWGELPYEQLSQQAGDYRLVYDRVGGVSYRPIELHTWNHPVSGNNRQDVYAAYVTDTWRPAKRLTFNLGLRWERNVAFVPEQVKVQGKFGTSGSFPRVDVGSYGGLAPRVGVAFDVAGDGKTVVKGTYGIYNLDLGSSSLGAVSFAQTYNQNSVVTTVYRWRDQDGNNDYTPGEVNLDPNGPDFLSVTGATNNVVNPDLKLARTHEVTGAIERELAGTLSIRGLYVYKKVLDQFGTVNLRRPYSVFNRPFTRRDPGPDGVLGNVDDAGSVTLYDYDPAYRGSNFVANMLINTDRDDSFQNYEVSLNRRQEGNWFAYTSLLATKYHQWLETAPQSPNDEFFPLNETWELAYRLAGGYKMPLGIDVSTLYQAYSGIPGQRTNLFRAADPDGGPSLPSSGSITLRMEPFGESRGDSRHIVNLRASRQFGLGGGRRFTAEIDAFNAFNSNVAWGEGTTGTGTGTDYRSGLTYGYVVRIVQPRALRFGVVFEF